ncbi:uncharacterized protein METZ01_LOCUS305892, partial [marine metagenome]
MRESPYYGHNGPSRHQFIVVMLLDGHPIPGFLA